MKNAVFWGEIMSLYQDPPHQLIPSSPDYLFSPKKAFEFFNLGSLLTCRRLRAMPIYGRMSGCEDLAGFLIFLAAIEHLHHVLSREKILTAARTEVRSTGVLVHFVDSTVKFFRNTCMCLADTLFYT
jgi:hypothetical protein